jgi:hypothetical protein
MYFYQVLVRRRDGVRQVRHLEFPRPLKVNDSVSMTAIKLSLVGEKRLTLTYSFIWIPRILSLGYGGYRKNTKKQTKIVFVNGARSNNVVVVVLVAVSVCWPR